MDLKSFHDVCEIRSCSTLLKASFFMSLFTGLIFMLFNDFLGLGKFSDLSANLGNKHVQSRQVECASKGVQTELSKSVLAVLARGLHIWRNDGPISTDASFT